MHFQVCCADALGVDRTRGEKLGVERVLDARACAGIEFGIDSVEVGCIGCIP
jgi:hypothetical protein